jgi:cardiolipin synthase (CMP-forming)
MNIPNTITLLRIVLVPLLVFLYLHGAYGIAIWLLVAGGISDIADGFIARRFNMGTFLGSVLDPLADKLIITASVITLSWIGLLPAWLAAAVVVRDLVIVSGAITYYLRAGSIDMDPTLLGKASTFLQFILVFAVLADRTGAAPLGPFLPYLFVATLSVTIISGIHYIIVWGKKGAELKTRGNNGQ